MNGSTSRQPSSVYKSPRHQNATLSEQNTKREDLETKKSAVFSPGKESATTKAFSYLIKTSSTPNKESASSPVMLKNLTNKSPLSESSKKINKMIALNKSKDAAIFPLLGNDERTRGFPSLESSENLERALDDSNTRNNEDVNSPSQENSKFQGHKLPTITPKKELLKEDSKKSMAKKNANDKNSSVLGLGKGEIDMNIGQPSPPNRVFIQLSNYSSPTKTIKANLKNSAKPSNDDKIDEVNIVGTKKVYAEDKIRLAAQISKVQEGTDIVSSLSATKVKYGSPGSKVIAGSLSGGEEDDLTQSKVFSPLMISPMKGAQRAAKPAMKKVDVLSKKRVSSPEARLVDVIPVELKSLKKKIEPPKTDIKKALKSKDEAPSSVSRRENAVKAAKEEKEREDNQKEKKKAETGDEEMEGWGKHESEESINRDVEEEEENEEKKQEQNKGDDKEDSPRRVTKQGETEKVVQIKEDRKVVQGSGKKSPRKEKSDAIVMKQSRKQEVTQVVKAGDKDPLQAKREQGYKDFMQRLNFSFNVQVKIPTEKTFTSYKYFLGKGNNSIMLKAMMKQRWWWSHVDNKEAADINFMWTQLKQNFFIEGLKQRRKSPFENLEWSGVSSHVNDTTVNTTTTIDSMTDCESDTTEGETKVAVKKTRKSQTSKTNARGSKKKLTAGSTGGNKSVDDAVVSGLKKLFTSNELMLLNSASSSKYPEDYEELGKLRKGPTLQVISDPSTLKMCNHLENNFHLANKKALLWNMKSYYEAIKQNVFDYLPLTFHVRSGFDDPEYHKFIEFYGTREKEIQEQEKLLQESKDAKKSVKKLRNIWIVKPGENTNRGVGIHVCDSLSQINELVATTEGNTDGKKRTYLIQQYLDKPLLYNKRKFDIRCYILMTCINGMMKGYWYQDGYIRTASKEFSLKNVTNKFVHLTNDAVQKKAEDYGKFESGNKLSYNDFQKYLDTHHEGNINFNNDIYPQLKQLATDAIKGMYGKIDPYRRENCFEVFGLDFMIDTSLRAWLIEVNTNPDINASSPVLTRVIPPMVENALRLTIDQMYPPPTWQTSKKQMLPENLLENNKFELVFDEVEDGPALRSILQADKGASGDLILEIVAEEEEEDVEDENKD